MTQVDNTSQEAGQSPQEASGKIEVSEEGITVHKVTTQSVVDTATSETTDAAGEGNQSA